MAVAAKINYSVELKYYYWKELSDNFSVINMLFIIQLHPQPSIRLIKKHRQQLATTAGFRSNPILKPWLRCIFDSVALISYGRSRAVPLWQLSIRQTTVTLAGIFFTRRSYISSSTIWPLFLKSNGIKVSSYPSAWKKCENRLRNAAHGCIKGINKHKLGIYTQS